MLTNVFGTHCCDQDLLTQLNILSRIQPNDALSTNTPQQRPPIRIQKPGLYRSVGRFCYGESRYTNVVYIQGLLKQVIDRHTECECDSTMRGRLVKETIGAINGLHNLKESYRDDSHFQATLDVTIETTMQRLGITHEDQRRVVRRPDNPLDYDRVPTAAPAAPADTAAPVDAADAVAGGGDKDAATGADMGAYADKTREHDTE